MKINKILNNVAYFRFVLLVTFCSSSYVWADMLISPTRIAISDRDRSAQVILINNGSETRSFRVEWEQKSALSDGGYEDLDEIQSQNFPTASEMIRFSPKQVTLAPGAKQIIKMGVRRPRDLADGDYRSHMRFSALPPEDDIKIANQTSINLKLLLSYSIPVILHQGPMDYDVNIKDVQIQKTVKAGIDKYVLEVLLSRSGKTSTYGSLYAYFAPNGSNEEKRVGELNGLNLYSELDHVKRTVVWFDDSTIPKEGRLRLVYKGSQELAGKTLAEKSFNL